MDPVVISLGPSWHAVVSKDGSRIASARRPDDPYASTEGAEPSDYPITTCDASGQILRRISPPQAPSQVFLSLSQDGSRLSTSFMRTGQSGQILWQMAPDFCSVAFSDDGRFVYGHITLENQSFLNVWDAPTGQELHRLQLSEPVNGNLAMTRDGATIAAASDTSVVIWNVDARDPWSWRVKGGILDPAFSPDGQRLAVASSPTKSFGEIRILNTRTREELLTLYAPQVVSSMEFVSDGKQLVGCSDGFFLTRLFERDGMPRLWRLRSRRKVQSSLC